MPRMMPQRPEGRNYYEYEEKRDNAIRLSSIKKGAPYIVRFRAVEPTTELFAYDMLSRVMEIKTMAKAAEAFSIIGAQILGFEGIGYGVFGVNQNGIAFDQDELPFDLEEVPYSAEYGYFVDDINGIYGGEGSISQSEQLNEDGAVELRQHLALTR